MSLGGCVCHGMRRRLTAVLAFGLIACGTTTSIDAVNDDASSDDATASASASDDDDGAPASDGSGARDASRATDASPTEGGGTGGEGGSGGDAGSSDARATDGGGGQDAARGDASAEGGLPAVDLRCAAVDAWETCGATSPCTCAGFQCVHDPVLSTSAYGSHPDTYCESPCASDADCAYFIGASCVNGHCGAAQCDISSVTCARNDGSTGSCVPWMSSWDYQGSFCSGARLAYGVCFRAGSKFPGQPCQSWWAPECAPGSVCVQQQAGQGGTCSELCANTLGNPTCSGGTCSAPEGDPKMPNCLLVCE